MITLKRSDTAIKFTDTLSWTDGPQNDLTGCTVKFLMSNEAGKAVAGTATIVNAALRAVEYAVAAGDLGVAGTYKQEWEVTFPDGRKLTVPTGGYNAIRILPDLG